MYSCERPGLYKTPIHIGSFQPSCSLSVQMGKLGVTRSVTQARVTTALGAQWCWRRYARCPLRARRSDTTWSPCSMAPRRTSCRPATLSSRSTSTRSHLANATNKPIEDFAKHQLYRIRSVDQSVSQSPLPSADGSRFIAPELKSHSYSCLICI